MFGDNVVEASACVRHVFGMVWLKITRLLAAKILLTHMIRQHIYIYIYIYWRGKIYICKCIYVRRSTLLFEFRVISLSVFSGWAASTNVSGAVGAF